MKNARTAPEPAGSMEAGQKDRPAVASGERKSVLAALKEKQEGLERRENMADKSKEHKRKGQESVWILNLLFYYLLQQKQVLFIIEEPESHLFPASQKYMTELITLVKNQGHSIVLTTHSPYVLGTLNNLLYAYTTREKEARRADEIIPQELWLNFHNFDAWFVEDGTVENCIDSEIHMIQNERIDEISKVINDDFERLLELQGEKEGVV